ncbi:MAG: tetratricopeptide repeat protein, partial [Armatimonadota bacterium]
QPDRPPRQRALASAFEWSHDLLSPASRALLAQLSIFRGGFVMGAAEAICDGPRIFDGVLDLCDHSFLSSQETAGRTRYLMLESIRGFAAARLEPELSEPLRARHAHYFLSFAQERDAKASGPDEATAFAELTDELDNLRAGMGWAVSTCNDRMAAEYAAALATFLWRCGHWQEQLECVDMGLEAAQRLDPPDVRLLGRLLYCRGVTAHDRGENQSAIEAGERGLRVAAKAGDSEGEILFLNLLALAARRSEEPARSRRLLEKALPLSREIGHPRCQGMTLHNLGLLAQTSGDPATAERFYREALPLRSEAGDERGVAETLNNLGVLAEADERLAQAQTLYRDALKSYVRLRGTLEIAVAVCNLGEIAHKSGDLAGAVELLAAAATALSELGSVHAEHAAQAFEGARAELSQEISPAPLPWREALLTAAEKALAEQAP